MREKGHNNHLMCLKTINMSVQLITTNSWTTVKSSQAAVLPLLLSLIPQVNIFLFCHSWSLSSYWFRYLHSTLLSLATVYICPSIHPCILAFLSPSSLSLDPSSCHQQRLCMFRGASVDLKGNTLVLSLSSTTSDVPSITPPAEDHHCMGKFLSNVLILKSALPFMCTVIFHI